ncbi:hypothetical protein [Streptomyces sp. NPDC006997]|uniref:hypothetical protein n=1 Tax=Streptomyces sp. NPDC006997 TaxID=3155356 RepID=UPI0033D4D09D
MSPQTSAPLLLAAAPADARGAGVLHSRVLPGGVPSRAPALRPSPRKPIHHE